MSRSSSVSPGCAAILILAIPVVLILVSIVEYVDRHPGESVALGCVGVGLAIGAAGFQMWRRQRRQAIREAVDRSWMSGQASFHVGDVVCAWGSGKLSVDMKTNGDGTADVQVYASDPKDLRKAGVFLTLGRDQWNELWRVLNETHAMLQRMHAAGQYTKLAPPRPLRMSSQASFHVGDVVSAWASGKLSFDIKTNGDGTAHLEVYACDLKNLRKAGVFLTLGRDQWNELWRVLNETGATLQRMHAAGQFTK